LHNLSKDNQRDGGLPLTNHKEPRIYTKATAFNLAYGWGHPRMMSSFSFSHRDQGPPQDANRKVLAPTFDANGQCNNGWVCEHRWPGIQRMVKFSAVVQGEPVENVWFGNGEAGFSRGKKGFFVVNARDWGGNSHERIYTGLSAGTYCDMGSGDKVGSSCTGRSVIVGGDGYADFEIPGPYSDENGFVAIHIESKL
jgi:alpha-amylase